MLDSSWKPVEGDLGAILASCPEPLDALARGDVPAIILRGAYPESTCRQLVERLIERELLFDPGRPVPEKFLRDSIPEGYYREGLSDEVKRAWQSSDAASRIRIDIGASLGYRGSDPDAFFELAARTEEIFETLFDGMLNPIKLIYEKLSALSRTRRAVTAHESDGRRYGSAIVRAHYGSYTYKPHFDSVRLRERRETYAVHRFEHQFAGVLVLQNAERDGETAQCVLHRCFWEPEVQPYLDAGTFQEFARERGIERFRICLEPGDLYFFNTRGIHEVPGLDGRDPRIVLATFIGYSPDEDTIFVWS